MQTVLRNNSAMQELEPSDISRGVTPTKPLERRRGSEQVNLRVPRPLWKRLAVLLDEGKAHGVSRTDVLLQLWEEALDAREREREP